MTRSIQQNPVQTTLQAIEQLHKIAYNVWANSTYGVGKGNYKMKATDVAKAFDKRQAFLNDDYVAAEKTVSIEGATYKFPTTQVFNILAKFENIANLKPDQKMIFCADITFEDTWHCHTYVLKPTLPTTCICKSEPAAPTLQSCHNKAFKERNEKFATWWKAELKKLKQTKANITGHFFFFFFVDNENINQQAS